MPGGLRVGRDEPSPAGVSSAKEWSDWAVCSKTCGTGAARPLSETQNALEVSKRSRERKKYEKSLAKMKEIMQILQ